MADTITYRIIDRTHVNQWDEDTQAVVPGWVVKARWQATGTVLPVFIPDTHYTVDNVDTLIRDAGKLDDAIHKLGA